MADINMENVAGLGKMYATFMKAVYTELIKGGFEPELARTMALDLLKQHILMSVDLAAKKNQDALTTAFMTKGGSS